jgi:hypothetical protein
MSCEAWPITWPCSTTDVDPELVTLAQSAAQNLLWAMGGRRHGVCTWTERYRPSCSCAGCCAGPYHDAAGWHNRSGAGAMCCRILLAHRPVREVTAVTIDGDALTADEYDVDAWAWLRRRGACWPCVGECDDPPVEVTYGAGFALPAGTAMAMGEVACEFIAGFTNKVCKLPSRAVSIARQGVTVQLADPSTFVKSGRLGLPIADAWLAVVNPRGLDRPSRVYSPDLAARA